MRRITEYFHGDSFDFTNLSCIGGVCDQIPDKHLPEGGRLCVHAGDAYSHGKQKCALLLSHILEDQEAEHRGIPTFKRLPLYCFCSVKGPCLQGGATSFTLET